MFDNFSKNSRIWVYPSNRLLNTEDQKVIRKRLDEFIANWNAHGSPINGAYEIYLNHFIVLAADENQSTVSGCSIDSSVKCIKAIGNELNIDFFNRLMILTEKDRQINRVSFDNLSDDSETYVFDTSVSNLDDYRKKFKILIGDYLNRFMLK
jgi:hypothetical protein